MTKTSHISNPLHHFPQEIIEPVSRNLFRSVFEHLDNNRVLQAWRNTNSSLVHEYLDNRARYILHVQHDIRQIDKHIKSTGFELAEPQEGIDTVLERTVALPTRDQKPLLVTLLKRCVQLWSAHPAVLSHLFVRIWHRNFESRRELLACFVKFATTTKTPEWEQAVLNHLIDLLATTQKPEEAASTIWNLFTTYRLERAVSNAPTNMEFSDFKRLLVVIAQHDTWDTAGKSLALVHVIGGYKSALQSDDWFSIFEILRGLSSEHCVQPLLKIVVSLPDIDPSCINSVLSRTMDALPRLEHRMAERILEALASRCLQSRPYPDTCLPKCMAAWRQLTRKPWSELATLILPPWGTSMAETAYKMLLRAHPLVEDPELREELKVTLKRYAP